MTAPAATRQRKPVVLLRPVPGDSVIHRLWAGTKLIVVAGIGVLLTFYPGWVPIGLVAALVLTTAWLAHIPRGALPSIPRWLWIVLFIGGATATFAGGSPIVDLGSVEVGLGGLLSFLRITAVSIVLLGLGAMVSWTTNVAEIAPAVAKLGRPLRPLRIPGRRLGGDAGVGVAGIPDADRRVPRALRGPQAAAQRGAHHSTGAPAAVGDGDCRSARRGDHRGAAPGRRDGRRDHRPRRRRADLRGAVTAETGRLGRAFGCGPGVCRRADTGTDDLRDQPRSSRRE